MTTRCVMSVSVSLSAWNNLVPTGQVFMNLIFEYFFKIGWGNSSFIKTWTRIAGTLHDTNIHFFIISHSVLPRMKNRNTQAIITIWRLHTACWILKATYTHRGCVILIAFPLQQWLQESASVLHYTYTACPVGVTKEVYHCFWSFKLQYAFFGMSAMTWGCSVHYWSNWHCFIQKCKAINVYAWECFIQIKSVY